MKLKTIVTQILIILPYFSTVAQIGDGSGTFTDERDNKTYRTVRIGNLTWMAENLDYAIDSSWCYNDDNVNCAKYGRLYTWYTARRACPAGWRLPTNDDWDNLLKAAGGQRIGKKAGDGYEDGYVWYYYWSVAGEKLKSKTGWVDTYDEPRGNGTDEFGFSALPGGNRTICGESIYAGRLGTWWSATDVGGVTPDNSRSMYSGYDYVNERNNGKNNGLSVRCSRDEHQ
jgi:uncharacterized protein (TIGR02145 family)